MDSDLVSAIKEVAPFDLADYQAEWFDQVMNNRVRYGVLSMGRGGGKSALMALLAHQLVHPDGHLHGPKRQCVLMAASATQASIILDDVRDLLGLEIGETSDEYRQLTAQTRTSIIHRESKAEVRIASSNPNTLHGLRPSLFLCDEIAQWQKPGQLWGIVRTSLGKVQGSKAIVASTAAADPNHVFQRLLADAENPAEKAVAGRWFRANAKCQLSEHKAWGDANPGLFSHNLPDLSIIKDEARLAQKDPGEAAGFRALRLNQGLTLAIDSDLLVQPDRWAEAIRRRRERDDLPPVVGVDIGGARSMSAAVAVWPPTGRLEHFAMVGSVPDITARALRDKVDENLYATAVLNGALLQVPDVEVPEIDDLLNEADRRWGTPSAIICDSYRSADLRDAAARLGWAHLVQPREQGWRHGTPDLAAFRKWVIDGPLSVPDCPLLASHVATCLVRTSHTGHQRIDKPHHNAHTDLAAAAVLAVGEAARQMSKPVFEPTITFLTNF